MLTKCRARNNEEAIFRKAGDREIAFDAATFVETLGVDQMSNRHVNLIRADGVEEIQGARSTHFEFVERSFVEEASVFTGHQMFVTNST